MSARSSTASTSRWRDLHLSRRLDDELPTLEGDVDDGPDADANDLTDGSIQDERVAVSDQRDCLPHSLFLASPSVIEPRALRRANAAVRISDTRWRACSTCCRRRGHRTRSPRPESYRVEGVGGLADSLFHLRRVVPSNLGNRRVRLAVGSCGSKPLDLVANASAKSRDLFVDVYDRSEPPTITANRRRSRLARTIMISIDASLARDTPDNVGCG